MKRGMGRSEQEGNEEMVEREMTVMKNELFPERLHVTYQLSPSTFHSRQMPITRDRERVILIHGKP